MSRYQQLQQLLTQDTILEKLSFYPDHLLDFRSIVSEWVEAQDWSGTLCLSGEELTNRSKELLQEALSKLQEKLKNAGFEFCNTETRLKKAYQTDPVKFVEELHHCLREEEELVSSMMSQEQMSLPCAPVCQQMSAEDLLARISNCRKLDQRVLQVLEAACVCLKNWPDDIKNRSNTLRDVFGAGDPIAPPFLVFQKLTQELDLKCRAAIQELKSMLRGLEWFVLKWKTWQLHECVLRKVEGESREMIKQVEDMCEQVCTSVHTLMRCAASEQLQSINRVQEQTQPSSTIPTPTVISRLCMSLKDVMKEIVEMLLVVREQPPLTMMIEKEKGQKDKEDINNSKRFKTTVGILGGKGFNEDIAISEVEIYLAFNQDLAAAQQMNKRLENAFKIYHDRPNTRGQFNPPHNGATPDSPTVPYERTYTKLRVEHFSRQETKHVYKQLYHVVYDVSLYFPLFMQTFKTQAVSFPIIVRTGANQASEHIGAQLWHSFSSPNVYDLQVEVAPSMQVSEVIQMINERIRFIGGEGLRDHEKEFLEERLLMAAGGKGGAKYPSDPTITLDNFIKDKVYLPRHGCSTGVKDCMDFSLWRWLHSIINLLDDPENLKQPWIDGIIYGFASRHQCTSALEGSIEGTFLLRFSESVLHGNHKLSKGGLAAVVQRDGQVDFAPPISSDKIEKDGLGKMIASIGCQYLLGKNLTISDLCLCYPPTRPLENTTDNRYQGWHKQELFVRNNAPYSPAHMGSPNPHTPPVLKREPKKAKRSGRKSQAQDIPSSKQHRAAAPESPESYTSVTSPVSISPEGRVQFQAVGVQELQPQPMTWTDSASNIPITVLSHMNGPHALNHDMVLDLPHQQFTELVTEQVEILDISESTGLSSGAAGSSSHFVQNVADLGMASNFLLGSNDPSLQGMLSESPLQPANGQALSIEDVVEYLKTGTESLIPPQHS